MKQTGNGRKKASKKNSITISERDEGAQAKEKMQKSVDGESRRVEVRDDSRLMVLFAGVPAWNNTLDASPSLPRASTTPRPQEKGAQK